MPSYNRYEDWWEARTLSLEDDLFVQNPLFKSKRKSNINIHCCNYKQVELKCGEIDKINTKRKELFESETEPSYRIASRNFCFGIKGSTDKHEYLTEHVRLWHVALIGDSSHHINDTKQIAHRIGNLHFTGSQILLFRKIYNKWCTRGIKTYYHVHPPASPLYRGKGKDIYAEVEGYARFFQDILHLKNIFEKHLSEIYRKTNFNTASPEIEDYINFFSNYFTDDMFLIFQVAYENVSKPSKRTKPLFSESDFHHEIFGGLFEKFKKKVLVDISAARDEHERKYQVSRIFCELRKTYYKAKNYCYSISDRLYNEKAFALAHSAFSLLDKFILTFKEENCCDIDIIKATTLDFPMFENLILRRFHAKNILLRSPEKNIIDKKQVLKNCSEMSTDFSEEYQEARKAFFHRWIESYIYNEKKMTEQECIGEILAHLENKYLSVDLSAASITMVDSEGKQYIFDSDFFRKYVHALFLKVQEMLNARLQKISNKEPLPAEKQSASIDVQEGEKKVSVLSFTLKKRGLSKVELTCMWNCILDRLKKINNGFIHSGSARKQLQKIFSGDEVLEPVWWMTALYELHHFVRLFYLKYNLVEKIKASHWQVAAKCFVDSKGKPIDPKVLKRNKQKFLKERMDLLESIVNEFLASPSPSKG